MADFLTINGVAVSVADKTARIGYEEFGVSDRVMSTKLRSARRGVKRKHSFNTAPMLLADSDALINLLLGKGVHWEFQESICSDTGVVPTAGYVGVTVGTGTTSALFSSSVRLKVASAGSLAYQVFYQAPDTTETIMFWFWNGASWDHYVLCNDGTKYKNGATYGSAIGAVTLNNGPTLLGKNISGGASADAYYNDVVWLPWKPSATMVADHYASGARWGRSPYVNMDGDLLQEAGPIEVKGNIDDVSYIQGNVSGGFAPTNRTVNFTLTEV